MCDDGELVVIPTAPAACATTVYEEEGHVIILKVVGGWQKHEGKWPLGFGPKVMVYRPFGPVKRKKSDLEEPIQSTKRTGSTEAV